MLTRVFFKEKPARALAALVKKEKSWYAAMLAKEIDCTYPHLVNTLAVFEDAGLITTESQGRINVIKLTEVGEDLAHDLEGLIRRLERIEIKLGKEEQAEPEIEEITLEEKSKEKKR